MSETEVLRVRDAKSSIIYMMSAGLISASMGFTLMVESYWHALSPQMLVIGGILAIIGLFLVYRSSGDAINKYHSLTQALFPKA
jgi:hypothetical protein